MGKEEDEIYNQIADKRLIGEFAKLHRRMGGLRAAGGLAGALAAFWGVDWLAKALTHTLVSIGSH